MADIQPNRKTSAETAAGAMRDTDLFRIVQGTGVDGDPFVSRSVTYARLAEAFTGSTAPDLTVVPISNKIGDYTLVPADGGGMVRVNKATSITITLALEATQAFHANQVVSMRQVGAGQVTLTPATGVTLNIPHGQIAATRAQGSVLMIHYVGSDEWDVTGDLADAP